MHYFVRHIKAAGQLADGDIYASAEIDRTFKGFVLSLSPLVALAFSGLMMLACLLDSINYPGALLLSFIATIPLSVGPVFLGLVAFAREKQSKAYSLMVAFNWLRLRLLMPVLVIGFSMLAAENADWFSFSTWLAPIGLVSALYGLYCIRRTAGLVGSVLECTRLLAVVLATIAIFLAIL